VSREMAGYRMTLGCHRRRLPASIGSYPAPRMLQLDSDIGSYDFHVSSAAHRCGLGFSPPTTLSNASDHFGCCQNSSCGRSPPRGPDKRPQADDAPHDASVPPQALSRPRSATRPGLRPAEINRSLIPNRRSAGFAACGAGREDLPSLQYLAHQQTPCISNVCGVALLLHKPERLAVAINLAPFLRRVLCHHR
jgi:hypothetical protein